MTTKKTEQMKSMLGGSIQTTTISTSLSLLPSPTLTLGVLSADAWPNCQCHASTSSLRQRSLDKLANLGDVSFLLL